jgi:hypothetical protein
LYFEPPAETAVYAFLVPFHHLSNPPLPKWTNNGWDEWEMASDDDPTLGKNKQNDVHDDYLVFVQNNWHRPCRCLLPIIWPMLYVANKILMDLLGRIGHFYMEAKL